MNLYIRLLITLITSFFKPAIHPREVTESRFRVLPHDIDLFGHMNNGRYLQIMDVARVDWMRRTRILDAIVKNRWGALLGGSIIRHCAPLNPGERYTVVTRVVSWETRWIFLEHRFVNRKDETVAVGISRAALRKKAGKSAQWVSTTEITDQVSPGFCSPAHPELVRLWLEADDKLVERNDFAHITQGATKQRPLKAVS